MNFGTILNSVTKSCVQLMVESKEKQSKTLAREFITYVRLKEILDKQFQTYHQLNSSFIKNDESAKMFIMETLSSLDKFSFEDILAYNRLLETKFNIRKTKSTDIDMAISKLIRYRTSSEKTGQLEYVESFRTVLEHITTVQPKKEPLEELDDVFANSELKFLQPKHIIKIALKKFNDTYSPEFDAEDRHIFNTLREGNQKKILNLYSDVYTRLLYEAKLFNCDVDQNLVNKLNESVAKVGKKVTQENLLDAYEMYSELKRLRENV